MSLNVEHDRTNSPHSATVRIAGETPQISGEAAGPSGTVPSFPPRAICIVGALIIVAGVGSVVEMIAKLLTGKVSVDFGFIGIPIGYGILIGKASSRKWALFFSIIGLILIVGFGGWITYKQITIGDQPLFADGIPPLFELILAAACCISVVVVLLSKKHTAWFDSVKKDHGPAKSLSWAVAVAVAVVMAASQADEHWVEEMFRKMYTYRVRVAPYNADTGKNITSITFMSDSDSSEKDYITRLPKGDVATIGGTDGIQVEYSGVAVAPVKGTLRSQGFHDTSFTLDQHTKSEIRIPMKPLSPGAGKSGDSAPK